MSLPLFQQLPAGSGVLFIRLRNLGEAVLDTANLRALKHFRPDLRISSLVEAPYAALFTGDPEINAIPLTRRPGEKRSSISARIAIVREIRRRRFAAVINLHGGPTSAQLTYFSGARHRVGAGHFRHSFAYNIRVPPAPEILGREGLHTVETQFAWFKWLGLPGAVPKSTSLNVVPEARESMHRKLSLAGIDGQRPYAVLAPTNEFYTKRWMPDRYAAIADELNNRGLQVVLSGAPTREQEAQVASVLAAIAGRKAAPITSLNIGELTALIAGARLFVGNDSGPAHIAAAVKTRLVVLFGPASSERWRPWTDSGAELVQNHFACNPCAMYTCTEYPEPECIRSITISQVIEAIDRVNL